MAATTRQPHCTRVEGLRVRHRYIALNSNLLIAPQLIMDIELFAFELVFEGWFVCVLRIFVNENFKMHISTIFITYPFLNILVHIAPCQN